MLLNSGIKYTDTHTLSHSLNFCLANLVFPQILWFMMKTNPLVVLDLMAISSYTAC